MEVKARECFKDLLMLKDKDQMTLQVRSRKTERSPPDLTIRETKEGDLGKTKWSNKKEMKK